MFGCRTNGALVWDGLRALYGLDKDNFAPAEAALQKVKLGQNLVFWQPRNESFPASGSFELVRIGDVTPDLGNDYAGIIESSLAAVYHHSKNFIIHNDTPLYVVGGAIGSLGIMRRVSAIWNRPVVTIEKGGAALGAAVAGISAFRKATGEEFDIERFSAALLPRDDIRQPDAGDVAAFHNPGSYLDKFAAKEASLIMEHPIG
jgi:xylulokinase